MRRWLTWNLVFRAHEWLKGHPTYRILRQMEASDRMSAAELERLQIETLRGFLEYCYANVPYVRLRFQEAGLMPIQVRRIQDLSALPIMTKEDVRKNRETLRSEVAANLTPFTTGGSSGQPLIFDLSKRRIASHVACRQRVSRWWGVSVGDPEVALWGSPIEVMRHDLARQWRDRFLSTRLLSAFEMNEATISGYLDIIERMRCRQIFGYPSAVYLLCQQAQRQGRNLRNVGVKAVFVTSEVLYPYQRELISKTFGCSVANGYGGRDSGFIAHECPDGGMHLMSDAVIVEVVDSQGRPVPIGEPGEIVVTDLYSHEAPFLRYATGDIGVLSSRKCPCGRPHPLLERIEGRANDSVVAPDSRIINALALIYPIREEEGIEQFRIYQKTVDRFHVQVVRNESFQAAGADRIRKSWSQLLRTPLDVTFEYLPELPKESSGKFRHVISEVPAGRSVHSVPAELDENLTKEGIQI